MKAEDLLDVFDPWIDDKIKELIAANPEITPQEIVGKLGLPFRFEQE